MANINSASYINEIIMNLLFSDNLYYLNKFRNIINIINFLESDNLEVFQVFKTIEQLK